MHDSCTFIIDIFFITSNFYNYADDALEVVEMRRRFHGEEEKSENGELEETSAGALQRAWRYRMKAYHVVTALAEQAEKDFKAGDLVFATMRFQSRRATVKKSYSSDDENQTVEEANRVEGVSGENVRTNCSN